MTPRDDVIISYGGTSEGQVHSGQLCPNCKGGTRGERSMSVGRTGGVLWFRCHRASCGFHGADSRGGYRGDGPTTLDEKRGRYREFKRAQIPANVRKELGEKLKWLDDDILDRAKWTYTPDYDGHGPRVIMPIIGPEGGTRGESFRSYWGDEPKGLINGDLAENMICWYKFRKYAKVCVLTEDQPSALRVASTGQADACALCGTGLNLDRILEIRAQNYRRVWLSLDMDAHALAVKAMKEFGPYLSVMRIKSVKPDIKDMSPAEFDLYMTEVIQQ